MKILLLAPSYLGLHYIIEKELRKQGHDICFLEDKELPFDTYLKKASKARKYIKGSIYKLRKCYQKYWENLLAIDNIYQRSFDLLFVVNGCSFHPHLLLLLRENSTQLRTVLYLWDSNEYYNYFRNTKYFDTIKTFDFEDSKKIGKDSFLPFFWEPSSENNVTPLYDISIVGTNHDNRYQIVSSIKRQCDKLNLKYFFKVVIFPREWTKYRKKLFLKYQKQGNIEGLLRLKIDVGEYTNEIISHEIMSPQEVNYIINHSKCILDTDRESQSGTTPRVIWALAQGKKVISTNKNLLKMPFYNPEQIMIIDRNNPIINKDFILTDNVKFSKSEYLENLRIDRWVKYFTEKD